MKNQNGLITEEFETIIKCPQGTELIGDHCKLIVDHSNNNKATKIKKL